MKLLRTQEKKLHYCGFCVDFPRRSGLDHLHIRVRQ